MYAIFNACNACNVWYVCNAHKMHDNACTACTACTGFVMYGWTDACMHVWSSTYVHMSLCQSDVNLMSI